MNAEQVRAVRGRAVLVLAAVGVLMVLVVGAVWLLLERNDAAAETAHVEDIVVPVADIAAVYDPFKAGDPLPTGFRQLLDRDQIEPVYTPEFTSADQVDWPGEMLVLGVAGTETSKAYPVTHLNQHEMVIDHLDGSPILVSW